MRMLGQPSNKKPMKEFGANNARWPFFSIFELKGSVNLSVGIFFISKMEGVNKE